MKNEQSGGLLPLIRETIHLLKEKHLPSRDSDELRLQGCHYTRNSVILEMITKRNGVEKISKHGSAGPSGLDARGWRRLLSSPLCGSAASDLCSALAALARKLVTTTWHHVDALTAYRLIPLDKKQTHWHRRSHTTRRRVESQVYGMDCSQTLLTGTQQKLSKIVSTNILNVIPGWQCSFQDNLVAFVARRLPIVI